MMQDQGTERLPMGFHPHQGRLLASGILVIVGTLLSAVGSVMAGVEFAVSTRRWLKDQQEPPSVIARTRLHQARVASQAATHAAMEAWHENGHRDLHASSA